MCVFVCVCHLCHRPDFCLSSDCTAQLAAGRALQQQAAEYAQPLYKHALFFTRACPLHTFRVRLAFFLFFFCCSDRLGVPGRRCCSDAQEQARDEMRDCRKNVARGLKLNYSWRLNVLDAVPRGVMVIYGLQQ